jgi:hypothetical protein
MAIKSAKPGIPSVSRADQYTLARTDVPRRAKSQSEQDIAKLTGLTRIGLLLLPVRFG